MSLDIVFVPCRFTATSITKTNPFTGAEETVVPHEPLSASEINAVQTVLKDAAAIGPDEFGYFVVQPASGGAAEIACDDLENGCIVTVRGMSPAIERILFELLRAADWLLCAPSEDLISITASPRHLVGLPARLPKPVHCASPNEIGILLSDGVQAWEKYRRQVGDEIP